MADDFEELKFVRAADVHKGGVLAGTLPALARAGSVFPTRRST
ncbi:hypothetical protein AHiyo1_38190 [Arthrobacter sp. Hiyo1]|nr:hypothetical protein AHiyo1_38190 [Arthrobacter sp. Hiyo1]